MQQKVETFLVMNVFEEDLWSLTIKKKITSKSDDKWTKKFFCQFTNAELGRKRQQYTSLPWAPVECVAQLEDF